jgi:hypothetical protein
MDGIDKRFLDWRGADRSEIIREHYTEAIPPDLVARIEALERFATEVADQINRGNADILALRQELAEMNAKLASILSEPVKYGLAPMAHFHDARGIQAA